MLPVRAASQIETLGGFALAAGSFGGNSGRDASAAGSIGFGFGVGFAGVRGAGLANFSSMGGCGLSHPATRMAAITAVSLVVICGMNNDRWQLF
jgi:hypothetical protein